MKRCRSRLFLLGVVVAFLAACAKARMPEESSPLGVSGAPPPTQLQPKGTFTPPAPAAARPATVAGRPVAIELPPEVKRLIDGVRRLNEEPGLILDRQRIYEALGVKATASSSWQDGGRSMEEVLGFDRAQEYAGWRGTLKYSELREIESWNVKVELVDGRGSTCYPSRLIESYWGKPFVYRPLGVHAFRGELRRKQRDLPPTGPHDGMPYDAEFSAPQASSANVSFLVGRGGCLISVGASRLFKLKEYSDDHIYR